MPRSTRDEPAAAAFPLQLPRNHRVAHTTPFHSRKGKPLLTSTQSTPMASAASKAWRVLAACLLVSPPCAHTSGGRPCTRHHGNPPRSFHRPAPWRVAPAASRPSPCCPACVLPRAEQPAVTALPGRRSAVTAERGVRRHPAAHHMVPLTRLQKAGEGWPMTARSSASLLTCAGPPLPCCCAARRSSEDVHHPTSSGASAVSTSSTSSTSVSLRRCHAPQRRHPEPAACLPPAPALLDGAPSVEPAAPPRDRACCAPPAAGCAAKEDVHDGAAGWPAGGGGAPGRRWLIDVCTGALGRSCAAPGAAASLFLFLSGTSLCACRPRRLRGVRAPSMRPCTRAHSKRASSGDQSALEDLLRMSVHVDRPRMVDTGACCAWCLKVAPDDLLKCGSCQRVWYCSAASAASCRCASGEAVHVCGLAGRRVITPARVRGPAWRQRRSASGRTGRSTRARARRSGSSTSCTRTCRWTSGQRTQRSAGEPPWRARCSAALDAHCLFRRMIHGGPAGRKLPWSASSYPPSAPPCTASNATPPLPPWPAVAPNRRSSTCSASTRAPC